MTYTLTPQQLKTLAPFVMRAKKIYQENFSIIVETTFQDIVGGQNNGTSYQRKMTWEIRPDGKKRMLSRERTWSEQSAWVDPTEHDSRREWR